MTISAVSPQARLSEIARDVGAQDTLARLRAVSLPTDTKDFVGILVWFLAQRERLGVLSDWAPENAAAAELASFGRAAWADVELLRRLRPVGDEHLAKRQLHGYTVSHYLAAMVATRRAHSLERRNEPFVERLRLLLLIRALEAADQGVPRESNLAEVCLTVRQVSDETEHVKWPWIERIAHSTSGFDDFVSETRFQLQKARGATRPGASEQSFYICLSAVLDKILKAMPDKYDKMRDSSQAQLDVLQPPQPRPLIPRMPVSVLDTDVIGCDLNLVDGHDESITFALAKIDTTRPVPEQRDQGTGIVLQSLEDSQYLRHSWHRLGHLEEGEFLKHALQLMQDDQQAVDRLGAALTVVAMLTSAPLSGLGSMTVRSGLSDDWTLDLHHGTLRRRAPRFPRRWSASAKDAVGWIRPLAAEWRIDLSATVKDALTVGAIKGRIKTIGDLWIRVSPSEDLHLWFSRRFAKNQALERLTAPVVSTVIGQLIFEHAGDHAQARLVSSSTRSGLPSACAYGAYHAPEIRNALDDAIAPDLGALGEPGATSETNATGSELDVDLVRMAKVIRGLTKRVDDAARQPQHWVDHHNHLSALCVIALLASTGARPVNSPFESLDWIDLARGIIYVEDKHSGPTRGARLCVLSEYARELLGKYYLPHLEAIALALRAMAPAMAAEIEGILSRSSACRLPLFFFLRAEPTFDWIEVSESQLTSVCGNPWPLPWNVFRHLHSTQLRRWGLDAEIRDALLSHGDRGAESHGEFSWRIPRHDLECARPLVNRLVDELDFRLPSKPSGTHVISGPRATGLDFAVSTPFGREARALRRDATHQAARRTAQSDIGRWLGNRPPSSLSEEEWDEIARSMLLRPDGLPHPMASLRYEVLEDHLAALWRKEGALLRLPTVRHIPLREGVSIFNDDVIGAQDSLDHFRQRFDATLEADSVRLPRRPVLAACLAALELALHCRVSHFAVLTAVACNSAAIRIVRFDSRYWLEWAYRGDWKDGRPCYRVPITELAAGWVGAAQSAKKRLAHVPDTPEALHSLVGNKAEDFGLWLRKLASLVGQVNSLELPCAMAAALSGERETAALPHADWTRTTFLAAPRAARDISDSQPASSDITDHFFRNHSRVAAANGTGALLRCKTLFDAIQQILSTDKLPTTPRQSQGSHLVAVTPQRRAADIARVVQASGFGHGDAPFVMAHYAAHLLTRPKRTGPGRALKASTALRYWETLKPGFLDFAFDAHLPDLEEEELTALYAKVVKAAGAPSDDQTPTASPGHARRRRLKDDSDAGHRALSELVGFHEFARELYGLEDPDWAEIAPGKAVGHGRPGIVLIEEYEAALRALAPDDQVHLLEDDSLAAAFVLFACARFGLRGGEAVGLQRRDWVEISGSIVVLVRSSHLRTLKNIRSKRQVPLIGTLSALEQALVDETLRRWEHREGINRNSPLLPGVSAKGFKIQQRWISARLLPLIKAVTRNPANTIHHLRHGFACRLLALLCGRDLGAGLRCTSQETDDARRLLMTSNHAGRRTLWAVARMLGHGSPATTTKAYAHVMDAWLPEPPPRPSAIDIAATRNLVNLDEVDRDPTYLSCQAVVPTAPIAPETLWVRSLRYLRLRALGNADAAWLSRLDGHQVEWLEDALREAAPRLQVMPEKERTMRGLLAGVRVPRWNALIDLASASDHVEVQLTSEWAGTVGANRQIVLFMPEHFHWAGQFVRALGMTPADCSCVHDPRIHPKLKEDVAASGLGSYSITRADYTRSFQIDRAVVGSPERVYPHRMALVPAQSGLVADTIELLIMWVTWLRCSTTTHA